MKNKSSNILMTTGRIAGTAGGAIGAGFAAELLPDCVPTPVKNGLAIAGGCLGDIIACTIIGGALCKHEMKKYQSVDIGADNKE